MSTLAIAIAAVAIIISIANFAISRGFGSDEVHSHILVSASGSSSIHANKMIISVFANATGTNASSAVSNLSASINALNNTVTQNSGLMATLSSSSYSVSRGYYGNCSFKNVSALCKNSSFFYASSYLTISMYNTSGINELLMMLAPIKDVQVQGVQAALAPDTFNSTMLRALNIAMANATNQAIQVANGRIISVGNVTVSSSMVFYPYSYALAGSTSNIANEVFHVGNFTVSKSVTVDFTVDNK